MGEEKRKWFQKGAFEDGYQFGDLYKTLQGTAKDVKTNFFAGAAGLAEKAIDAGAYAIGGVGGLFGADKFKDKTKEFITKDLINEEKLGSVLSDSVSFNKTSALLDLVIGDDYKEKYDEYSLLGEKSDALVQSGGQLAAQIGLQAAGVPWWVTTGVASFGSSVEKALNEGASYGEAGLNGAITVGAEILSEKLFAGSGLGEKGLINTEPLTKWMSNKVVKTFADYGVDMVAEGTEEVFSQFAGNLSSSIYKRGKLKDILFSKEAAEGYLESFIGGMVLSGFANGRNVGESTYNHTDYRNGLTQNEQKVFDRSYGEKVVEAKVDNGGKRLTSEQKAKIYDDTLQLVKSGNISSDVIESSLGGEDYNVYKNISDNYDVLERELRELETVDSKSKTQEQVLKQKDIKQRLEQIKTKADKLKSILQNKVIEKIYADNIHLKDRESYILDSYTKQLGDNALKNVAFTDEYNYNTPKSKESVTGEYGQKRVTSQSEVASFSSEYDEIKTIPDIIEKDGLRTIGTKKSIDEDVVVEGMWEDSPNNHKNDNVEKSQFESVETAGENDIIEETKYFPIYEKTNSKDGLNNRPYAHLEDGPTVGSGKDFTELQKRKMLEENKKRNGGIVISDNSNDYYDVLKQPKKCVGGVSPDPSEWQFDHILPKSKGGTNSYSNCQIVSRKYNRKKWDREE